MRKFLKIFQTILQLTGYWERCTKMIFDRQKQNFLYVCPNKATGSVAKDSDRLPPIRSLPTRKPCALCVLLTLAQEKKREGGGQVSLPSDYIKSSSTPIRPQIKSRCSCNTPLQSPAAARGKSFNGGQFIIST